MNNIQRNPILIFSGIGTQWPGMANDIFDTEHAFTDNIRRFDDAFSSLAGWSPVEKIRSGNDISDAETGHPCVIAIEYGLFHLLLDKGVRPRALIGHSAGEIAAALAAGILSVEDAALLTWKQNCLLKEVTGVGKMMHISLPADTVESYIGDNQSVAIAAINSPSATVIAGEEEKLQKIMDAVTADHEVFCRLLRIDIPLHTQVMEPYIEKHLRTITDVTPGTADIPIYSSLRGGSAEDGDFGISYWCDHIRYPVRFGDAVRTALSDGADTFIEVSPHAILQDTLIDNAQAHGVSIELCALMNRDKPAMPGVEAAVAMLNTDYTGINTGSGTSAQDNKVRDIMESDPSRRLPLLKEVISESLTKVSDGTIELSDDLEFLSMGVTSLLAVQIRNELQHRLGVNMPAAIVYNHPTIERLASHILGILEPDTAISALTKHRHTGDTREPLAIIGFSCRLPGGANDVDSFWSLIKDNVDAVCPVPPDRWDKDAYYDPDSSAPGKSHTYEGGFLTTPLDGFDADFFNISAREARQLDPQQRLLLEVLWESFENAGIDIQAYKGSKCGVFLGMSSSDYGHANRNSYCRELIDAYTLTGSTFSAAAGRLAYLNDFQGPCYTVDTACSSSLIALHCACRSLREKESDMAVVGGVNLMLMPDLHVAFTKLGAVSKDGRSKSFDDGADGYGRGEGCVMLLLKRQSDAERDGDTILALVRGSATNQDGKSNGLTAPNGLAQERVIADALHDAGLAPEDINYVEAHGTGTALGDSIEIGSLANAYCGGRSDDNPLLLGSVKANIGHLEPAAGVAGIAKILLSMKHRLIPANIHIKIPNTRFDWDSYPIVAPTENTTWEPNGRPRRAGISAFGFSGTNVHAIFEEYKPVETASFPKTDSDKQASAFILPLSAGSPESLNDMKEQYAGLIEKLDTQDLSDVCFTSSTGRAKHRYRLAVTGSDTSEIASALRSRKTPDQSAGHPVVGMLFTGQGSQYPEIGKALYGLYPEFTEAVNRCAEILKKEGIDLLHLLYGAVSADELAETANAQPVIASIEYAVWYQWLAWGIKPDFVSGHSIGEYPAAVAAGIMDVEQMLTLVAARARAMSTADKNGTMAAVFAGEETVKKKLQAHDKVVIAAVNAPESLTIAGPDDAVETLCKEFESEGIGSKMLRVSHAFHSPLMEDAARTYGRALEGISFENPHDTIFISTVTGKEETSTVMTKEYWIEQITRQVRFKDASALMLEKCDVMLEVGGTAALSGLVKQAADTKSPICIPSLSPKADAVSTMLSAAAELFNAGVDIDGKAIYKPFGCKRAELPTYPFNRENHWMQVRTEPPDSGPGDAHPVLGHSLESPAFNGTTVFETIFDDDGPAFLHEHIIYGLPISPGAGHIAMLLAAVRETWGVPNCVIRDIDFLTPLIVPAGIRRHVQIIIEKENSEHNNPFQLASRQHDAREWTIHCRGVISKTLPDEPESKPLLNKPLDTAPPLSVDDFYSTFVNAGYTIGEGFKRIADIEPGNDEARCRVTIKRGNFTERGHVAYPGAIDAILQTGLPCFFHTYMDELLSDNATLIPMHIDAVTLWRDFPDEVICYSTADRNTEGLVRNDIVAMTETGEPVMKLSGLLMQKTNRQTLYRALDTGADELLYTPEWIEREIPDESSGADLVVLSTGSGKIAGEIHKQRGGLLLDAGELNRSPESLITAIESGNTDIVLACDSESSLSGNAEKTTVAAVDAAMALVDCVKLLNEKNLKATFYIVASCDDNSEAGSLGMAGSALWGAAMSLFAEDMARVGAMLSCGMSESSIKTTAAILGTKNSNGAMYFGAIRNGRYYAQTLSRLTDSGERPSITSDSSYLITGGNGALGIETARWLANQGAGCIILLSRSGVKNANIDVIEELRAQGCRIEEFHCDVSNRVNLAGVFDTITATLPQLRGVFHAAGVLDDATISEQDRGKMERVIFPKALGALLLHELTRDMALDYFVLYSSAAAVLGSGGQSNYSAANSMLNALAFERRSNDLAALSVCWGPWLNGGMASEDARRGGRLAAGGILGIDSKTAFPALEKAAASPEPVAGIMAMDWELYFKARPDFPGEYLATIASKYRIQSEKTDVEESLLKPILDEYSPERREELEITVALIAAETLGSSDPSRIARQQPLMEQGFDSLMAVEARNRLIRETGYDLEASFLFNYPTIEKISSWFAENALKSPADATEASQDTDDILKDIENLLE